MALPEAKVLLPESSSVPAPALVMAGEAVPLLLVLVMLAEMAKLLGA